MPAFDPRDRGEVGAAKGNAGYGGGGGGQGGRGGTAGVSTTDYMAGKLSGFTKNPTTGNWSNKEFDKRAGIGGHGDGNTTTGLNVPGNPSAPGYLDYDDQTTTMPNGQRAKVGDVRDDYMDWQDIGNTPFDDLGNMIADAVGFGEQNPYDDRDYGTPGNPTSQGANWRVDPLTILGTIAGGVFGVPFGGTIADFASEQLGRPLSVGLGNDVFGGSSTTDPITGEITQGNTTHTGGSVTVQGVGDDNDTFYGLSPSLGAIANGASNTLPSKHTYVGTNPAPTDQAPEPFTPTTPSPSPIDTPPNSPIQVDAGNTQLSDQQLTDLFSGFMQMPQARRAAATPGG